MKKLLLILLCLPLLTLAQQTYVPDDGFEGYLANSDWHSSEWLTNRQGGSEFKLEPAGCLGSVALGL